MPAICSLTVKIPFVLSVIEKFVLYAQDPEIDLLSHKVTGNSESGDVFYEIVVAVVLDPDTKSAN